MFGELALEISVAVFSEVKDRVLRIASDVFGKTDEPGHSSGGLEPMQPLGILSRPNDPDVDGAGKPTKGASLLVAWRDHEGFAMPLTDSRIFDKIPELPKGSTVVYACNGSLVFLNGQTGTVQILVPYVEDGVAKTHNFSFDVPSKSIQLNHGDGMGFSVTAGGKNSFILNNKDGKVSHELNDEEHYLRGPVRIQGGCSFGDPSAAQGVITEEDFLPWKAMVDAALTTLAGAAGSMVPPIASSASAPVTGSPSVKASK